MKLKKKQVASSCCLYSAHTVDLSLSVRDRQTDGRTHEISHTKTVLLNL